MHYNLIKDSNSRIDESTIPKVCVFVGATSGIGKFTIESLVKLSLATKIYLVGRQSSADRMKPVINDLRSINPKAEIIWTEGEVSLLADCHRICNRILSQESSIDLLFLNAGYAPLGARHVTSENIEVCQALEYYSRISFILHLLPLLKQSANPRVVCVLAGGLEKPNGINVDDFDLAKPGNWSITAQRQYGMMNSVALERLATEYPEITFLHSWPGFVATGNVDRSADPGTFIDWFFWLVVKPLIGLLSYSFEESGDRHLFLCTSAYYGGKGVSWHGEKGLSSMEESGKGVFLTHHKNQCLPNGKNMAALREQVQDKQWKHTMNILKPYL